MHEFRQWWGNLVQGFLSFMGNLWERLASGVFRDWDIRIFIFGMAVVLIVGLFGLWKRKA